MASGAPAESGVVEVVPDEILQVQRAAQGDHHNPQRARGKSPGYIRRLEEQAEAHRREHPDSDAETTSETSATGEREFVQPQASEPAMFPAAPDQPCQSMLCDEEKCDTSEWTQYIQQVDAILPISSLCWDQQARYGQIRPLDGTTVAQYEVSLREQMPVKFIEVVVKDLASMSQI